AARAPHRSPGRDAPAAAGPGRVSPARLSAGRGATSPTMTRYENAPSSENSPATTSGTTKPPVLPTMTPTKVAMQIPARLDAKFWIPPSEATWRGLGATSDGSDQTAAAAKARLP